MKRRSERCPDRAGLTDPYPASVTNMSQAILCVQLLRYLIVTVACHQSRDFKFMFAKLKFFDALYLSLAQPSVRPTERD